MKKLSILIILLILQTSFAFANDVTPTTNVVRNTIQYDHVVWNGIPIHFTVPVGQERILKFPGPVSFHNSNPRLNTNNVSIQNNAGFLYITAKKPFESVRMAIVLRKTGQVILVDLSSQEDVSDTPVELVIANNKPEAGSNANSGPKPQMINYVTLMRYAVQHLYSPERLVEKNSAIVRIPMYTTRSINLFRNDNVVAMPLVSWRGGGLYVTAVLLKNKWKQSIILDPRNIRGNWLAGTFYPTNYVTANGTLHDRTTLFLISSEPFNSALNKVRGYI